MGFLMRASVLIYALLSLMYAGCSTTFTLDRPLVPAEGDWLQLGGNEGRTHVAIQNRIAEGAVLNRDQKKRITDSDKADIDKADSNNVDFDPKTTTIWEFSLDGRGAKAAPLLVGGAVIFSSTTGIAEAVDLRSGELVGVFPCKWFIHGTPAIAAGCLFVATNGIEPLLHCFDLKERILRYEARIPSVHASLCAVGGGVIMAAHSGEIARYLPDDTAAVWKYALGATVTAAPAASDSLVFIAGQNGDLVAISLASGELRWRIPTDAAFLADPSARAGSVAAVNSTGAMILADAESGELRWRREFGEPVYQGIAWRGDTMAVVLSGGDVVLLREADGFEFTRYHTGELPGAAPIFDGGRLLLLHRRGSLLAIDIASGARHEIVRLPLRSEAAPLLTEEGIVLVDEEGEAVCVGNYELRITNYE
jgi:outer membrane protein assembly factor BamB